MTPRTGPPTAPPAAYERYLAVLGVPARAPGLDALRELVDAHVTRVPFENLSKLLFRADPAMRLPPLERWLDGIERHGFGGTCYANNSRLTELLAFLGYDVRLCGADMSRPDVHVAGIVTLAGRGYLVDAGYGAPFHGPMPLDLAHEHVVELGADRWVLTPRGADGRSRVTLLRGGTARHGYAVNPAPRRVAEFAGVIEDSFAPDATFMNALVIARFSPGRSRVLHNLDLLESDGPAFTRRAAAGTAGELPVAIEEHFGIPARLTRAALTGIEPTRNIWG